MRVVRGVTRMSTLVSLETALPSSVEIRTATKTPKGPAAYGSPGYAFAKSPTAAAQHMTSIGALSANAIPTPMHAPVAAEASLPASAIACAIVLRAATSGLPRYIEIVFKMVPTRSDAKRP